MTTLLSHDLPPPVDLDEGEVLKEVWRPQFRYFCYKVLFVSGLTTILLGGGANLSLGVTGLLIWLVSFLISSALYAFVFDDIFEWSARREDVWVLTNRRLIFYSPRDDNSPAFVALNQIKQVKTWLFWGLRVRLLPRDQVMMLFLPDRPRIRDLIQAAVENATPPEQRKATAT